MNEQQLVGQADSECGVGTTGQRSDLAAIHLTFQPERHESLHEPQTRVTSHVQK